MNYQDLQNLLDQLTIKADAAHWHGALCGLFCVGYCVDEKSWVDIFMRDGDASVMDPETLKAFCGYLEKTFLSLNDPALGFDLLLPSDSVDLAERVAALGVWCAGFINGLNVTGSFNLDGISADAGEAIQDINEIAKVASFDEDDLEAGELNYTELVEYVRIGVIMLYEELNSNQQKQEVFH